jgi:hypothetical protein
MITNLNYNTRSLSLQDRQLISNTQQAIWKIQEAVKLVDLDDHEESIREIIAHLEYKIDRIWNGN